MEGKKSIAPKGSYIMWKKYPEEYSKLSAREKQQECAREKQQEYARLPRDFFSRDGLIVARELLGKILVHETSVGTIRGIITEVESYMGINDKGSHTYGGRRTERTEPMFHKGGTSYVYFTYGMYHCMNIATGQEGDPQAVLIRSVVPADEESRQRMLQLRLDVVRKQAEKKLQRQLKKDTSAVDMELEDMSADGLSGSIALERKHLPGIEETLKHKQKAVLKTLADGPGKLCIAMEISKADNCLDMIESQSFYVTEGIEVMPEEICVGRRIGIDYAEEAADYLWRFYLQ